MRTILARLWHVPALGVVLRRDCCRPGDRPTGGAWHVVGLGQAGVRWDDNPSEPRGGSRRRVMGVRAHQGDFMANLVSTRGTSEVPMSIWLSGQSGSLFTLASGRDLKFRPFQGM